VENFTPYLKKGLTDAPYVRKSAVMALAKLYTIEPPKTKGKELTKCFITVLDKSIVTRLYEMLNDRDPIVVVNSIAALSEVLDPKDGLVLDKSLLMRLVSNRLSGKRLRSFC
jgi:vesicle coat complex subunit